MVRPVHTPAVSGQHQPGPDPAFPRLGTFVCVLALYLAFAGVLIGLGYGLWPALASATTACVIAGEVARRVITAGTAPLAEPAVAVSGPGTGLPELLDDISRVLERIRSEGGPGNDQRRV